MARFLTVTVAKSLMDDRRSYRALVNVEVIGHIEPAAADATSCRSILHLSHDTLFVMEEFNWFEGQLGSRIGATAKVEFPQ